MIDKGVMLGKMIVIATAAHKDQYDKGGVPYILHPLKVMHYLKTDDVELMCIAVGHDVYEDSDITSADLRDEGISERVIQGIYAMSKRPGQTYKEYKRSVFGNVDAMKVKLCDLRHNSDIRRLKGVGPKDTARLDKYSKFYTEIKEKLAS